VITARLLLLLLVLSIGDRDWHRPLPDGVHGCNL
jgi:hypothetical protein